MSFIFAKWATVHALNPMGPIASYLKAHNLSGAPSYFMISHYFNITCNPKPKILFFCHLVDCFNTGNDVLAATHVDCTLARCSPSHEAVCSASTRRVNDDLQPKKKNGVSNGAWTALRWWLRCALNGAWTTPSNSAWTALVVAPKNGTSTRLNGAWKLVLQWRMLQSRKLHFNAPENWRWYGAAMGLVAAPKMAAEQGQVWGLKHI